jgi:hypothetical protein
MHHTCPNINLQNSSNNVCSMALVTSASIILLLYFQSLVIQHYKDWTSQAPHTGHNAHVLQHYLLRWLSKHITFVTLHYNTKTPLKTSTIERDGVPKTTSLQFQDKQINITFTQTRVQPLHYTCLLQLHDHVHIFS